MGEGEYLTALYAVKMKPKYLHFKPDHGQKMGTSNKDITCKYDLNVA